MTIIHLDPNCTNRSSMNGHCLLCDWKTANAKNLREGQGGDILAACYESMDRGFVEPKGKDGAK